LRISLAYGVAIARRRNSGSGAQQANIKGASGNHRALSVAETPVPISSTFPIRNT